MKYLKMCFQLTILLAAVLFLDRCSVQTVDTISDVDNKICGKLVDTSGKPATNATVVMRSCDFRPDIRYFGKRNADISQLIVSTETDDTGKFMFNKVPKGIYSIVGVKDSILFVMFDSVVVRTLEGKSDTVVLSTGTLEPPSSIHGTIDMPDDAEKVYVFVLGLDIVKEIDADGIFYIEHLPEGTHRLQFVGIRGDTVYTGMAVRTVAGDTAAIDTQVFHLYRVIYNGNGSTAGEVPSDDTWYGNGEKVLVRGNTSNLVKTGYKFAGWNTKRDGTGEAYTPDGTFVKNIPVITLYAQWENPPGMVLVKAAGRSFEMGGGIFVEELPVHTVKLSHDFWMDTTEVSYGRYSSIMKWAYGTDSHTVWNDSLIIDDPTPHRANWYQAVLFCNALTKSTGSLDTVYNYLSRTGEINSMMLNEVRVDLTKGGYHLPTEAQWEFACRGGVTTDFFWGKNYDPYPATVADSEEVDRYAVWQRNKEAHDLLSGFNERLRLPNTFGLYDMCGNLSEWCNDWYGDYSSGNVTEPAGPAKGTYRVHRGGASDKPAVFLRSEARSTALPDGTENGSIGLIGFRVCLTIRE